MKKIQVLVLMILFLSSTNIYPDASFLNSVDPYKGMAVGQPVSAIQPFETVDKMNNNNILNRPPTTGTKQNGSKVTFAGKMQVQQLDNGIKIVSVGNVTKTYDKENNLLSTEEGIKGKNIAVVKNDKGEITGYKTKNANGSTKAEYDEYGNLTKSYYYDKFGKTISAVVNELTQEKTLYDSFGREKGTIAMGFGGGGYVISTCQYDDISYEISEDGKSILEIKNLNNKADAKILVTRKIYTNSIDHLNSDGSVEVSRSYNIMYYDKDGLVSKTVDSNGITVAEYFYKKDKNGNKILTHVLNPKDKSVTYYENGKAMEERNDMGALTKKYYYDGARLLYTVSMGSDESFGDVTYYDKAGRALTTTHKFVQYDPSSDNRIDFVCGSEIVERLTDDEVKAIKNGTSSLNVDKDYVIRTEINPKTKEQEDFYYFVPNGIEGVSFIRKEVENDLTGEMETHFYRITEKYEYDSKGNIKYVINLENNTRTYYKNNKMYYTAANDDSTENIRLRDAPNDPRVLKIYEWDVPLDWETPDNPAKVLRYVYDTKTQTTQWFNASSQFVYLTYNDRIVSNNIYDNGKLAGTWNNQTKELTILRDEKQWITLKLNSEPGVNFIRKVVSFAEGDVVDWSSINSYVDYYELSQNLLDSNIELYKLIDTFEKYKEKYKSFKEQEEILNFTDYLKML